jgi:GDP-D-mannose dehydratase
MTDDIISTIQNIASGTHNCLLIEDLDQTVSVDNDEEPESLRDFIRTHFSNLGIEIEFSGKGINERGVVIDIDEDRFGVLGLNANTLSFGQTVVKAKQ